jgi:hypothetical protein
LFGLIAIVVMVNLIPALSFVAALFDGRITPSLVDRDFVNYWMGAHLSLQGDQTDLFGQRVYFAHLEELFGPQAQSRAWSYPPHMLLIVFPLGLIPYEPSLAIFLVLSFMIFLAAAELFRRTGVPSADRLVLSAAQNGFLTGALLLFGLSWRGRHPVLAGLAFGLLTIKPQLGILIPVLLLFERDWATILWSAVFALVLVALSASIFGVEIWHAYLTVTIAEQRSVLTDWTGGFLYMMPTAFAAARTLGADPSLAALLQGPFSALGIITAAWLFMRDASASGRTFALLCATFVVSPYGFDYDMGALAVASATFLSAQNGAGRGAGAMLLAVALLPAFVFPLGSVGLPIAPLLLAIALCMRLSEVLRRVVPQEREDMRSC